MPVASSRIPPSSGRREGDSFDPTSRRAPPSLLLLASSGRRDGDSFDRASRRAPPSLLLFASSGWRKGDLFDRASRSIARRGPLPCRRTCCLRRPGGAKETRSTARHGAPPRARSKGCWGKGHKGRGVVSSGLEGGGWGDEGATEMGFLS